MRREKLRTSEIVGREKIRNERESIKTESARLRFARQQERAGIQTPEEQERTAEVMAARSANIARNLASTRQREALSSVAKKSFDSQSFARERERKEYQGVEKQLSKDLDAAWGLGGRGGGGGGGSRGGVGAGAGGGPAGRFRLRDRLNLGGGAGIIGSMSGSSAIAVGALVGFAAAVKSGTDAIVELRKGALATGGTYQEVARLRAAGIPLGAANELRQRMGTDPFTMMEMGFLPDPRMGGPTDNAALIAQRIRRLHELRGNKDAFQRAAFRTGATPEEMDIADQSDISFRQEMGRRSSVNTQDAKTVSKATRDLAGVWQDTTTGLAAGLINLAQGRFRQAFFPDEFRDKETPAGGGAGDKTDKLTQSLDDLAAVIKTTNREMIGRGMQDRGAFPSALWGTELMRGIRSGAIRMGAFK